MLTMTRVKFSGMEFVVGKFHRPTSRLRLIWMLQLNGPTSNIVLCPNYHIFQPLNDCVGTFLQNEIKIFFCLQIVQTFEDKTKTFFYIPIKLSESIEYFSANFLLTPSTLATS